MRDSKLLRQKGMSFYRVKSTSDSLVRDNQDLSNELTSKVSFIENYSKNNIRTSNFFSS